MELYPKNCCFTAKRIPSLHTYLPKCKIKPENTVSASIQLTPMKHPITTLKGYSFISTDLFAQERKMVEGNLER